MEIPQKIFVAIGTAAVVGLAVVGGGVLISNDTPSQQSAPTPSAETADSVASDSGDTAATKVSADYKDGKYTATQLYPVPGGEKNSIIVTLTIKDGKITAVTTENKYNDRESGEYIEGFEAKVGADAKEKLLGKYSPSRIAGASLTTEAFARTLDAVRTQATT